MSVRKWLDMLQSREVSANSKSLKRRRDTMRRTGAQGLRRCFIEPLEGRMLLSADLISERLELLLNDSGQMTGAYQCVGGTRMGSNLLNSTLPYFATVTVSGSTINPMTFSYNSGTGNLTFGFNSTSPSYSSSMTVHVDQGTTRDYFTFNVTAISTLPESLQLLNFTTTLITHLSPFAGINANDSYAIYARPLTAAGTVSSAKPLVIHNEVPSHMVVQTGVEGTSFALGGCDYGTSGDGVHTALSTLISNEGLLTTSFGGPSAMSAALNRESYMFASDITCSNVGDWISLAKAGGFEMILLSQWWQSLGHYAASATRFPGGLDGTTGDMIYAHSLKYVVDQIHAAGLHAGFHCLSTSIGTSTIDPVNDGYLTEGNPLLGKDYSYTLNTSLSSSATTIVVNGVIPTGLLPTTWSYAGGNALQIGNEVIQYTGYSNNGTNTTFTGLTRGAFGSTTPTTTYSAGTAIGHLKSYGCHFCVDASQSTTLLDAVTANLAAAANTCGIDMIFLDGIDVAVNSYTQNKAAHDIVANLSSDMRVEASGSLPYAWTFQSAPSAWDYAFWGEKEWVDQHVAFSAYMSNSLLPVQLGWFGFHASSSTYDSLSLDEFEYLCAKARANDYYLSVYGLTLTPTNGRQSEFLSMWKNWQSVTIDAATKALMAVPNNEFHLETLPDGSLHITQVKYATQKADGATTGSASWTVNNLYGTQNPTMRIQALSGVAPYTGTSTTLTGAQADVTATTVTANTGVTGAAVSWATCPGGIPYTGYPNTSFLTFTAHNTSAAQTASWAKAARVYTSPLDIGTNGAVGVWVYGDGKGEIINLQLFNGPAASPTTLDDHYVTVNFTGWKYFELALSERDVERYGDYVWPYAFTTNYWAIWRTSLTKSLVTGINIYYNNIPVGDTATCYISLVKALPIADITLTNPQVTIGSSTVTFPTTLTSGQYIEFNSMTDCKRYDINGNLLGSITPTGTLATLNQGANLISFTDSSTSGYGVIRANVTLATYDKQSANYDAATVGSWSFEEASGSTVKDASPYLNNGALTGTTLPTRVTGPTGCGNALQFNGSSSSVTIPTSNSLNQITGSFSVQMQFKFLADGPAGKTYWTLATKEGTAANSTTFHIYVNASHLLGAYVCNGTTGYNLGSGIAVNDGAYHQVVLVYDDVAKSYTLYLDGQARATQAVASDWKVARNTGDLVLGNQPIYSNYFNGIIDEVRVLSRPLNPTNVMGAWKFEETSGSVVYDTSGHMNNGTLSADPPTRVTGQTGYALQFEGAAGTNSVTIPNSDSLQINGSFAVQLQFKYNGDGDASKSYYTLATKEGTAVNSATFHIYVAKSNHYIVAYVCNGTTTYTLTSGIAVNDGAYHVVRLVYDDAARLYSWYLDGNFKDDQSVASDWKPARNTSPIVLGNQPAASNYFNGIIDEVQVQVFSPLDTEVQGRYGNYSPTVAVAASVNNHAPFLSPTTSIPLSASVSDSDGTIAKVAFYQGTTWIADGASNGSGTYTAEWLPTAAGTYAISAKATDNDGAITISGSVNIVVCASPTNQAVDIGQTATFLVETPGVPVQTYQWKKDGTNISGATGAYYTTPVTIATDNGAEYSVVVTNSYGSTTSNVAKLYVNSTPVGWWKLDETSGTTAADSSGGAHIGTVYNAATWTSGQLDGAVSLNGTSQYVGVPSYSAVKYTGGGLTLAGWFYINSTETTGGFLISKPWKDGGIEYNYVLRIYADRTLAFTLQRGLPTEKMIVTTSALSTGTWHYIAATVDFGGALTLYVDGEKAAQGVHEIASWTPTLDQNKDLCLGTIFPYGSGWAGVATYSFDGTMDNVRVYTQALSAEAIAEQARAPVGFWKLNDASGANAADASGNGYTGTLINGPTWTNGYLDGAVSLDGSNDYVSVPDVRALKYTGNGLTLGAWVYIDSTESSGAYLITKAWNSSGEINYTLRLLPGRTLQFYLQKGMATEASITTTSTLPVNEWHHVAVTVDGTLMTIYVDGVAVASDTHSITSWTPSSDGNKPLAIGTYYPYGAGSWSYPTYCLDGELDNVKVYDHALNAAEVKVLAVDPVAPPTTRSVTINDGNAQRSKVAGLIVAFSEIVAIDAGVFEVLKQGAGGGLVSVIVALMIENGKTIATMTFGGSLIEHGSLTDGEYPLTVRGNKIRNSTTLAALDSDGNGFGGGNRLFENQWTDKFFRKFGDSDGDHDVDGLDLMRYKQSYFASSSFKWYLDLDGDEDADGLDLLESKLGYLT